MSALDELKRIIDETEQDIKRAKALLERLEKEEKETEKPPD